MDLQDGVSKLYIAASALLFFGGYCLVIYLLTVFRFRILVFLFVCA